MCGIAGLFGGSRWPANEGHLRRMTDAIRHRGPDADGHWVDVDARIALGHRRLSILDLSPLGAQPMRSAAERFVMVFNGEIYNFPELRKELEGKGHRFRGHSDTEIALAAFEQWGVRAGVSRLAGMFAIAVWDRQEQRLSLTRDRLGEKPLYLARLGDGWGFASELKALVGHPDFDRTYSSVALAQILRHRYVQAPHCIYATAQKLRPGTILELTAGREPVEHVYWSAEEAARTGLANPFDGSDDELVTQLDTLLRAVVDAEMAADVPLGAFLSGGIDSSLIVALMQAQRSAPVRTFTIGVDDPRYDEAPFAEAVAKHLGTEHTTLFVSAADALPLVAELPRVYDEPMADYSQLPTMLVSRLTRQHVTVALSGDGGDELFGGYLHHRTEGTNESLRRRFPRAALSLIGHALAKVPDPAPDWLARRLGADRVPPTRSANALSQLGAMLSSRDDEQLGLLLSSTVSPSHLLHPRFREESKEGRLDGPWMAAAGRAAAGMLFDTVSYLPDDVLVKVDRAAMAYSLETRAPLLDHRVFEFAWRIPVGRKIQGDTGKLPLRRVLDRYVPRALVDRPKRGFTIPLAQWLRGELRSYVEACLADDALRRTDLFDPRPVRTLWRQHVEGVADHADRLWSILAVQAAALAGPTDLAQ